MFQIRVINVKLTDFHQIASFAAINLNFYG